MSESATWRLLPKEGKPYVHGVDEKDKRVTWVAMTAGFRRWAVGIDANGLTFESSNNKVVECKYDTDRKPQGGVYPVLLDSKDVGSATVTAHNGNSAVASFDVSSFRQREVRIVARNVLLPGAGKERRHHGTYAKNHAALTPLLDRIFISQGGLTFKSTQGADVELSSFVVIEPRKGEGPRIDARNEASIQSVFKPYADAHADFTVFFCSALYGAPCAAGLAAGAIILIDELWKPQVKTDLPTYFSHVLAHELVHAMGHTIRKFKRNHSKLRENLMYYSTEGGTKLYHEQVELIASRKNWYRL